MLPPPPLHLFPFHFPFPTSSFTLYLCHYNYHHQRLSQQNFTSSTRQQLSGKDQHGQDEIKGRLSHTEAHIELSKH